MVSQARLWVPLFTDNYGQNLKLFYIHPRVHKILNDNIWSVYTCIQVLLIENFWAVDLNISLSLSLRAVGLLAGEKEGLVLDQSEKILVDTGQSTMGVRQAAPPPLTFSFVYLF